MATYKYKQTLFDGANAGYVEYNITPDFGTALALGESFVITGKVYCGNQKRYGFAIEAVNPSESWFSELGRVNKVIAKGKSASFTVECSTMPIAVNAGDVRGFSAFIRFYLAADAEFAGGELTSVSEDQKLSLLKERLAPVISGATFSDATVITVDGENTNPYTYFEGAVQGKSDLSADVVVQLDPLDTSVSIETAILTLGNHTVNIPAENVSGNVLHIGKLDFSGSFESFGVLVTDSKGKTGEYSGGAFEVYPYSSPRLERNGNRELAERYETVKLPNNTLQDRLSADATTLWANFRASVSPIGGMNVWSIWRRYKEGGDSTPGGGGQTDWVEIYSYPTSEENIFEKAFEKDKNVFYGIAFSATERHTVEIEVRDYFETALLRFTVEKSGGYFNVEKNGVAAGMRSTATEELKKFESAYPVYPYEGIAKCDNAVKEIQLTLDSQFGLYPEDPGLRLRVYGNMVHLSGIITPASSISGGTTERVITTIPQQYAPKYPVTVLQQASSTAFWMLRVYPMTDHDITMQGKAVFSRHRNGASYSACNVGDWLPLEAMWIV